MGRAYNNLSIKKKIFLSLIFFLIPVAVELIITFITQATITGTDDLNLIYASINRSRIGTIICTVAALLLSIQMIRGITQTISNPIQKSIDNVEKISQGDLTVEVAPDEGSDEPARLDNAMIEMVTNIKQIITQIQRTTQKITLEVDSLGKASQEMSQSAGEQASSSEEISASIEEMNASIKQNSDHATENEKITKNSAEYIKICSEAGDQTVKVMTKIADTITVIDEIAFQTNILALNAAVEAARAG